MPSWLGIFWWFDTIKFLWMHQLNHGYVACGIIIEKILRGWQSGQRRRSTRIQFKRFLVVLNPSSWISGQSRTTSRTNRPISDQNLINFVSSAFTFQPWRWRTPIWWHRCWWRMLETKCVGDTFKMLVTDLRRWWPI